MATATHHNQSTAYQLGNRFEQLRETLALFRKRRAIYRRTFNELAALGDRDLADIGIHRSHIRRAARETADMETQHG
ncbi:hypothetical protein FIU94_13305 [Sulfitobacter sp. THAF37]|uniref:DUF1127 domain-containing protein n=1 Tax=Sulfitobacter sp. THAF37 TaxID=2587855 RepID=UPI001268DDAF|nr:DUF1127 domain-containing protein [Sulfitobacter sp. THAF37]QFT59804.1 hypothetical protein FIU94_13305 [Sulfitobacter sp. THAF37]